MRIALARRGYSATGGAEKYLQRFAAAATTAGHECVLYTDADWPQEAWSAERKTISANSPAGFSRELAAHRGDADVLFSLDRVSACDVYRAGDGVHAGWLQRRAHFEAGWRQWFRGLNAKHRETLKLERELFANHGARRVVANSRLVRDEIVRHFGYPSERITVIYNGIAVEDATPPVDAREQVRSELGLPEDEYVALFVGSGWDRKGLRFAIEAVRRLEEDAPILLVAGRGRSDSFAKSERVRFLGPRSDIPALMAAADVFVLPTIYDPFSNACLEAIAAGLPVITSCSNGFAEIIKPDVEGDVLRRPDDIDALSFSLCAWADPLRRESIRPQLLAKAREFTMERNVAETLAVLEQAISERA